MTANAPSGAPHAVDAADAGPRLTTLDPDARYATIIDAYFVAPERTTELLDLLLHATAKILRYLPGFVSANLHVSFDRTRVVNYSQWSSRDAILAARSNPSVAALMNEASGIADSFTPIACELRQSVPAAARCEQVDR